VGQGNIAALEAALASVDCSCVSAYSGEQALRSVLAHDFAAIVLLGSVFRSENQARRTESELAIRSDSGRILSL
jgi:hypothetical protein